MSLSELPAVLAAVAGSALLGGATAAVVLLAGILVWAAAVNRRPSAAELLGPVFLAGLLPLTLLAALLVPVGGLPPAALGVCLLLPLPFARRVWSALPALSAPGEPAPAKGARRCWPWLGVGTWLLLQLAICAAPTTAWDAYTLHYAIVESLFRDRTLLPQGYNLYEYGHLNGELLNALWIHAGGERAANVFAAAQVLSLAATVFLLLSRSAPPALAWSGVFLVLGLPVCAYQATGGWIDTLLVQAALAAFWAYEEATVRNRGVRWALLAGLFAGYAWGVKQSAPVLLLPLVALGLRDLLLRPGARACILAAGLTGLAAAAPWLLRTWSSTGNPLFPAFPGLTRLPHLPSLEHATGERLPLPGGLWHMLLQHSAPARLTEDGIPPWFTGLLLLGAGLLTLRWKHSGSEARRAAAAAAVAFLGAWAVFPGNSRYALFAYVLGMVAALSALAGTGGRLPLLRWAAGGLACLSFLLAAGLAGGRLRSRLPVLSGRVPAGTYRQTAYPYLGLLESIRDRASPQDGLLVFNGLSYLTRMRTYNADPRGTGPALSHWETATPGALLDDLRRLRIRWVLLPFGYGHYRNGLARWAAAPAAGGADQNSLRARATRSFPEWQWDGAPFLPGAGENERFARVLERWAAVRSRLRPVAGVPGLALYEVLSGAPS